MKGQIALEYVMLIGMFFLAVIVIFYFATTESVKTIQINKANDVVNSIAKSADYLYSLGPGSQDVLEINMPGNVKNISLAKNEILLKLGIYGDITDVYASTRANLTGNLTTSGGIKHISLKVLDNGAVQIAE